MMRTKRRRCENNDPLSEWLHFLVPFFCFDEICRGLGLLNKETRQKCEREMDWVALREQSLFARMSPAWHALWGEFRQSYGQPLVIPQFPTGVWPLLRDCGTKAQDLTTLANELQTASRVWTSTRELRANSADYQNPDAVLRTLKLLRMLYPVDSKPFESNQMVLNGCLAGVVLQQHVACKEREHTLLLAYLAKDIAKIVQQYSHPPEDQQRRVFSHLLEDPDGSSSWNLFRPRVCHRTMILPDADRLRIASLVTWKDAVQFLFPFVKQQATRPVLYHWPCYFSVLEDVLLQGQQSYYLGHESWVVEQTFAVSIEERLFWTRRSKKADKTE